jgi:hypothetical protein
MIELTEYQSMLLAIIIACSLLGAVGGVFSAFLDRKVVPHFKSRLFLGLVFGLVAGCLVFSMLCDVTPGSKEIVTASGLFSLLFGLWAGRSANRKLDDRQKTQVLIDEVCSSKTLNEITSVVEARTN